MKKVLVLGSTGAMGRYLVPCLVELGYDVTGVSLDDEIPCAPNVTCIKGNAKDREFITELLKEKFDGIVNFMSYASKPFDDWYQFFLDNTDHYIFLSSCRVYADEEVPVRESSPRLLDVSKDQALLASNDYCIHKAKAENLLWASDYNNFTIVRPATTFSNLRFQLVTLEAAKVFTREKVVLVGNESQTVGPLNAPAKVHYELLGAEVVLLEGIRLQGVPEGVYLLNAAPLNLGKADGAPCRAILIAE